MNHNIQDLFPVLMDGLKSKRLLKCGKTDPRPLCRAGQKSAERIACASKDGLLTVLLIGERPGGDALSAQSLSAYFAFQLNATEKFRRKRPSSAGIPKIRFEYTRCCRTSIPADSPRSKRGSVIVEKISEILKFQAAGNRLESLLKGGTRK